jgi:hypothetical protein
VGQASKFRLPILIRLGDQDEDHAAPEPFIGERPSLDAKASAFRNGDTSVPISVINI